MPGLSKLIYARLIKSGNEIKFCLYDMKGVKPYILKAKEFAESAVQSQKCAEKVRKSQRQNYVNQSKI